MSNIEKIRQLRQSTNAGFKDCSAAIEEAKGDSDTLGGLIIELVGRIPKKNERLNFHNLLFSIEASDKRKIKRVKITIQDTDSNGID